MVESGQTGISPVDFASRRHPRLPVEVVEHHELITRSAQPHLATPQRPSFYIFLLMRDNKGFHTVDFSKIPAHPGRLILIRPGQVQVFDTKAALDATMVLSQPVTSSNHSWFPGQGSYCDLDDDAFVTADNLIEELRGQQARFEGDQPTVRLMIALFNALVALYDKADAEAIDEHLPDVYIAFRNAIETDLTHRHDVVDYARHLGYSARTITRACKSATGQTAKQILVERIVLEAKRLLVHTDSPAATISSQLGFSEATNFNKFFIRYTSQTPHSFRHLHKRTG